MKININNIENYVGQIIKVFTINDERIAAKLINTNDTYLLLENTRGFRSRVPKNEVTLLFTIGGE
jgi:hypothetical protein